VARPDRAVAAGTQRQHARLGLAAPAQRLGLEAPGGRVIAIQAAPHGPDPDGAVDTLGKRADGRLRSALGMADDTVLPGFVGDQALELRAYPHAPIGRGRQRPHPAQAALRRGVTGQLDGPQPVAVVARQALARRDPHEARAVLGDGRHRVLRHGDAAELHLQRARAGVGPGQAQVQGRQQGQQATN
jgi:hypothetical protein